MKLMIKEDLDYNDVKLGITNDLKKALKQELGLTAFTPDTTINSSKSLMGFTQVAKPDSAEAAESIISDITAVETEINNILTSIATKYGVILVSTDFSIYNPRPDIVNVTINFEIGLKLTTATKIGTYYILCNFPGETHYVVSDQENTLAKAKKTAYEYYDSDRSHMRGYTDRIPYYYVYCPDNGKAYLPLWFTKDDMPKFHKEWEIIGMD